MTPPIHKYMYIIAKTILPLYRFRHLEDASERHPTPDTIPNQAVNLLASQLLKYRSRLIKWTNPSFIHRSKSRKL